MKFFKLENVNFEISKKVHHGARAPFVVSDKTYSLELVDLFSQVL
jgi:hypothetical protein